MTKIFQETLLGPQDFSNLKDDFYHTVPQDAYPDFEKELGFFAKVPLALSYEARTLRTCKRDCGSTC